VLGRIDVLTAVPRNADLTVSKPLRSQGSHVCLGCSLVRPERKLLGLAKIGVCFGANKIRPRFFQQLLARRKTMEEDTMQTLTGKVEIRDLAPGLWIWRAEHHQWKAGDDWQPIVTSTDVESGGERIVIDPLVPKAAAEDLWKRLDNRAPTIAAVTIPDHVRDIDEFVTRYKVHAFGPRLFWPDDMPNNKLEIIEPDRVLPGGVVALYDGRGRLETPLWLPEQRVIVFGDALTERAGVPRSGLRHGMRSERCPRCESCYSCRLSKLSFHTVTMTRCMIVRPMSAL